MSYTENQKNPERRELILARRDKSLIPHQSWRYFKDKYGRNSYSMKSRLNLNANHTALPFNPLMQMLLRGMK